MSAENNGRLAPVSQEDRGAYEQATAKMSFTKEFFAWQQAVIADTRNTMGERFLACVRWRSHGQNCLYCVDENGQDAWQKDFARWLGVHRRRIFDLYAHYVERGYLRLEGKRLYPVLNPTLAPDKKGAAQPDIIDNLVSFEEWWKVQFPEEFAEYVVLQDRAKIIQKVRLGRLWKWRRARTNGDASLYETERRIDVYSDSSSSSSISLEEEEEKSPAQTNPPEPEPESVGSGAAAVRARDPKPSFEDVRKAYPPQRMDAGAARTAYQRTVKTPAEHANLMQGMAKHIACERWRRSLQDDNPPGRFIPLASKFIREHLYLDAPPPYIAKRDDIEADPVIEMLRKEGYR